jgi:hypothetical protein
MATRIFSVLQNYLRETSLAAPASDSELAGILVQLTKVVFCIVANCCGFKKINEHKES